jgi:uroporphyrin-III C-methyltransferase
VTDEAASTPANGDDDMRRDPAQPVVRVPAASDMPARATAPPAGADRGARALAWLALGVAVGGVGVGAWSYLHPNVKAPDLSAVQSAVGTANNALRDAQKSMQGLNGEVDTLRQRVDALAGAQASVGRDLDTVRDQTLETAEAMQHLAVGAPAGGDDWKRTEAEHLMQAANIALQLNHDPATALAALEAADERLSELGDPALTTTRGMLADEIAALRALEQPDVAGIALTLGSLAARVDLLPLADVEASNDDAVAAAGSGWQRAVAKIGDALKGMVSIHKTGAGDEALLAPEERFFLHRNLELELESARLAALRGDAANYAQSLASAQRWLQTRFAANDAGVRSALDALAELANVKLVTSWPDISASLAELRRVDSQ